MVTETDRVMVDIKTLGLEPGAAIISIGACRFAPQFGWMQDEFYTEISVDSNTDSGLTVEGETLSWRREQNNDPAPLDGDKRLDAALGEFREFVDGADELWANSPKFDMGMLEAAYDAVGMPVPWDYYQLRDVRTLRAVPGAVELDMQGDEHHALDDARHQASEVAETLAKIDAETFSRD